MKKNLMSVVLFAALAMMAVGCQKENTTDYVPEISIVETSTGYTVQYAVDGVLHSVAIYSKAEEQTLMQFLMALTHHSDFEVNSQNLSDATGIDVIPAGRYPTTLTTFNGDSAVCIRFDTML